MLLSGLIEHLTTGCLLHIGGNQLRNLIERRAILLAVGVVAVTLFTFTALTSSVSAQTPTATATAAAPKATASATAAAPAAGKTGNAGLDSMASTSNVLVLGLVIGAAALTLAGYRATRRS